MTPKEAYKKGFIDGLTACAWWKDSEQHVGENKSADKYKGSPAIPLREAIAKMEHTWNYSPPEGN